MVTVMKDVLIVGAGPAGVTLALKLRALGMAVAVVAGPLPPSRLEGWSARVIEGLRRAGADHALEALGPEAPRAAVWDGQAAARNTETLVDRQRIGAALLADLAAAQAPLIREPEPARLRVEARGRRAPRHKSAARGPKTVALSAWYADVSGAAATLVESCPLGWVWAARAGDGWAFVQVCVDAHSSPLMGAGHLESQFMAVLAQAPQARDFLRNGAIQGAITARDAGAVLAAQPVTPEAIRVGDAAFALDPLSGHGVFEAVGGALAAAAVIHTLLARPDSTVLAQAFYQDRARAAFWHHAAMGREFYAQESQWADAPFWRVRRAWPEDVQLPALPAGAQLVRRPVVVGDFVEEREVIVTPAAPRGVLTIAGVPVADLWRLLQHQPALSDAQAAAHLKTAPDSVALARAWLKWVGMI